MTIAPPLSPEELRQRERQAFLERFRLACLCNLELRQERAGLECEKCGAPLVRIVGSPVE